MNMKSPLLAALMVFTMMSGAANAQSVANPSLTGSNLNLPHKNPSPFPPTQPSPRQPSPYTLPSPVAAPSSTVAPSAGSSALTFNRAIDLRFSQVYRAVGRQNSLKIQCGFVPPEQAANLKNEALAYFQSHGQNTATFDREYEVGFQEGLFMLAGKNQRQREMICATVGDRAGRF